jgi:hypothetical protein
LRYALSTGKSQRGERFVPPEGIAFADQKIGETVSGEIDEL